MEHLPPGATPAETVAEVLRRLIEWFTANPEMARTQSELFLWTMRNKPELANRIYTTATEMTEKAIERAVGPRLDKAFLASVSRLLIQMTDGLLVAWFAHGDVERLKEETRTACRALALLVENH
ncbi:transcriptional regulator [Metapseudomonas furukawaii]|uniref:Transcriptional regulator n=2 Tax=Metapseudomonas furukawaii TaxID=1149133 RepID=A0AAD1C3M6_METFU|nr:transcriptional regulator [Pseudomonas furukawaii]